MAVSKHKLGRDFLNDLAAVLGEDVIPLNTQSVVIKASVASGLVIVVTTLATEEQADKIIGELSTQTLVAQSKE